MPTPVQLICNYGGLVNDVGYDLFGLRPTSDNLIDDGVASENQATDILKAIAKGLQFVYSAHTWRFLRPRVAITTRAAYSTGTITVDADGNVTGSGTTFPTYSASAGGVVAIPSVGSFAVASYVSGTSLVLVEYTGGAVATASTYTLYFNTYPMPTGIEALEGPLTHIEGFDEAERPLEKVSEQQIRALLTRNNTPYRPDRYAEIMGGFDPTAGSERSVVFYPVPDASYVLTAIGVAKQYMVDAVNRYPLGGDILAPVIVESCLAAAERDIKQMDAGHPDAVHNRALVPLLAIAIQRDKERGAPETLGVDYGSEALDEESGLMRRNSRIYWDAGAGITGYI